MSEASIYSETQTETHDLESIVKNLLIVLSKKERYIIIKRFGIKKERETLERIGNYFQITRERVRQLEKNALNKLQRHFSHTDLGIINKTALRLLQDHGGLYQEDLLINQLLSKMNIKITPNNFAFIRLSLSLENEIVKEFNTLRFRPYFRFSRISNDLIDAICEKIAIELNKQKKPANISDLNMSILQKLASRFGFDAKLITAVLEIDKRIIFINNNTQVGLFEWRNINPRTIRDKASFILKEKCIPLHFLEIAHNIIEKKFDNKKINIQAVHNELIRNKEFVLIGRGIYALKEWGYQEGTVKDIIKNILAINQSLTQEEIISEVLRQRKVKKVTILLNLKNKPEFERIGRKIYKLKNAPV